MFYHFTYTSGANPYIAKTDQERDRVLSEHETAGEVVAEVATGFYIVDDKKIIDSWPIDYIKVNLPATYGDYMAGYGESVFVIVSANVKKAYDADENGTSYTGILDNDSYYYIGLNHGAIIPFEMRGENKPVVPYSWLTEHHELNKAFFKDTPQNNYL